MKIIKLARHLSVLTALIGLFILPITTLAQGSTTAKLEINVEGLRSQNGWVMCAVWNHAAGFPGNANNATAWARAKPKNGQATCVFENLSPGSYGVSFIHDENTNKSLDANALGIPTEGFGFGNNARGRFGPPNFSDTVIHYPGHSVVLSLNTVYL